MWISARHKHFLQWPCHHPQVVQIQTEPCEQPVTCLVYFGISALHTKNIYTCLPSRRGLFLHPQDLRTAFPCIFCLPHAPSHVLMASIPTAPNQTTITDYQFQISLMLVWKQQPLLHILTSDRWWCPFQLFHPNFLNAFYLCLKELNLLN